MPVQPVKARISTTEVTPRGKMAAKGEEQQDGGDDGREDVVDPLQRVAELAAKESPGGAPGQVPTRCTTAAARPTTEPRRLDDLASTSRPRRSPPKGRVGWRTASSVLGCRAAAAHSA